MLGRRFQLIIVIWTTLAISLVLALSKYVLVTGSP
jgi:hypothetical protein